MSTPEERRLAREAIQAAWIREWPELKQQLAVYVIGWLAQDNDFPIPLPAPYVAFLMQWDQTDGWGTAWAEVTLAMLVRRGELNRVGTVDGGDYDGAGLYEIGDSTLAEHITELTDPEGEQ